MTTLIVNIQDGSDAGKIAEAMRMIKGVVKVEEKQQSFEEAAAECGAVSVDEFIGEVKRQLKEYYDNA